MALETEHNGYKINYAENQDVWRCWTLELEAKTLSALKTKINGELKRARAIEAMPALLFDGSYGAKANEVVVTLIADATKVWVFGKARYGSEGRAKVAVSDLMPDTPEVRSALKDLGEMDVLRADLERRMKSARAAIPRLSMDDLARLEKAA